MEKQSKESRGLEAHCRGGQGQPRAVAPSGGGYTYIYIYMNHFPLLSLDSCLTRPDRRLG